MPARHATLDPIIRIGGQALDEEHRSSLKEILVDTRLEGPDLFELTFHDPDHELMGKGQHAIGDEVTIAVKLESQQGRGDLITGEITALEADYGPRGSTYTIRGYDATHRLARNRATKAYVNQKYSDVARSIAGDHGLDPEVDETSVVHDHILRANQTDWEFLSDLGREIGFEVGGRDGALHFRKPPSATDAAQPQETPSEDPLQLTARDNLLEVRLGVSAAAQTGRARVTGWDRKTKEAINEPEQARTEMADPPAGQTAEKLAGKVDGKDFVASGTPYRTTAEAKEAAAGLAERNASRAAELFGVAVGHPHLRAGATVSVGGFGPHFNGRYTLTAARHIITPDENYRTEIVASGAGDPSLLGLSGGGDAARDHRARLPGVATAVVTNVKDPEDQGRVKVAMPWLAESEESDWAPVAQILAGDGYGAMFLPEVGDEVLVAFEQGDFRHPFVIGSLYNGKDKPDKKTGSLVASNGKIATRRLVTREHHGLVFFDESSNQGLRLRTGSENVAVDLNQTDQAIRITNEEGQGTVEIDATGKVTINTKADVDVTATGNVAFDAKGDFTVDATNIELNAKANANVKGSAQLGLEGQAQAELKSSTQTSVSGNAMVEVKGGTVNIN